MSTCSYSDETSRHVQSGWRTSSNLRSERWSWRPIPFLHSWREAVHCSKIMTGRDRWKSNCIYDRVGLARQQESLPILVGSHHSPGDICQCRQQVYSENESSALRETSWRPKEIAYHQTMLKNSWSWKKTCSNFEQSNIPPCEQLIIFPCLTFTLKEMDMIYCNCDFVYEPTVLQLQLKSDPAKSRSGQILGIGYLNPVSSRKSISVHP